MINKNISLIEVKKQLKKMFDLTKVDEAEINLILQKELNLSLSKLICLDEISILDYNKILKIAKKRVLGEPFTKIYKSASFYGYNFYVNNNVLSPRKETEILVEQTLKFCKPVSNILDLCTGSGCIAISLKKENSMLQVEGVEISEKALYVAKKNAKLLDAKIHFFKSDLFSKVTKKYDFIVSNPPYIKSEDIKTLDKEVKNFDPILALDGGKTGYDFYEKIIKESKNYLKLNGYLILEIGKGQDKKISKMLEKQNFSVNIIKDYAKINRVIIAKLN